MVFNATFNNISDISGWPVLLEETVQLSSLTKRLNKRSIAESNLIYIDKTNMINSVEFVIREVIELLFHGR
jgi:hypothetical protein